MSNRFHFLHVALFLTVLITGCTTVPRQAEQQPAQLSEAVAEKSEPVTQSEPEFAPKPNLTIAAVGDIMLGTDFPDNRLPPHDGAKLLAGVKGTLSGTDVAFGNLEGGLFDGEEPAKRCKNPALCYLFRTPSSYGEHLKMAGFDVVSLANNHARDFGEEGRSATMATLDSLGILHSGRAGDIASWEINGVRIAMIAFAPFAGSHDMLNDALAETLISEVAEKHDVTLVSIHAGAEGDKALHIPFMVETYHGENRGDVVKFAHLAVDAGADMVIGHGPHVPRALELYRDRLIAYSLGNFATYRGFRITGNNGLAPILVAELKADGRFVGGKIVSGRQLRPNGTVLDPKGRAASLMKKLSEADFPDNGLMISEKGVISRKEHINEEMSSSGSRNSMWK